MIFPLASYTGILPLIEIFQVHRLLWDAPYSRLPRAVGPGPMQTCFLSPRQALRPITGDFQGQCRFYVLSFPLLWRYRPACVLPWCSADDLSGSAHCSSTLFLPFGHLLYFPAHVTTKAAPVDGEGARCQQGLEAPGYSCMFVCA